MRLTDLAADWRSPITQRQVWALAVPMILSNISVPLVGLVDTAVIGHMDAAYHLGGVAVGTTLITFVLWAAGFLRMGTTGFVAQAWGRGDGDALRLLLAQLLWLAVLLALAVWLLREPLLAAGLHFIDASPELIGEARRYVDVRLLSLPAALANFVLIGWFIGAGVGRAPMMLLLAVNLTNLVLDIVLVVGLDWGVAGAAWATVAGDYCGLLLGFWLLRPLLAKVPGRLDWRAALCLRGAMPLMQVNRDILIRTLALESVFYLMVAQGSEYGDAVIAANAVLLNFLLVTSHGLDGLAHAVEGLGGSAIGARDRQRLRRVLVVATGWSLILSLAFVLAFTLFGEQIVNGLTDIESVRSTAQHYLPWMAWLPLVAVWGYLLDGLFIGATRARAMRNAMLISVGLVYVPTAWLFWGAGNHALWFGFHVFMLARGLTLGSWFVWLWQHDRWITDDQSDAGTSHQCR
ncbi:MATE family efflux transporter [Halopseudomonas nanhaiensis]|uniref:MATE family efflux transporter n=1 Tax=Halopseudomonas nanhaiensis TaxID=2830842 RepID=UPI001CBF4B49|nr:MATE family efflux transporter [Halopseudomonas nanhaiensis]